MSRKILVTSALPMPTAASTSATWSSTSRRHLGALPEDARQYMPLRVRRRHHGTPIMLRAEKEGITRSS